MTRPIHAALAAIAELRTALAEQAAAYRAQIGPLERALASVVAERDAAYARGVEDAARACESACEAATGYNAGEIYIVDRCVEGIRALAPPAPDGEREAG